MRTHGAHGCVRGASSLSVDVLAGLKPYRPGGGCFVIADVSASGMSDVEWCQEALQAAGVGCVPLSAFYVDAERAPKSMVRIAICKTTEIVEEAVLRLTKARASLGSRD